MPFQVHREDWVAESKGDDVPQQIRSLSPWAHDLMRTQAHAAVYNSKWWNRGPPTWVAQVKFVRRGVRFFLWFALPAGPESRLEMAVRCHSTTAASGC